MAKDNFWDNDPVADQTPADPGGDFWLSDPVDGKQNLPEGVQPSTAGAGRGSAPASAYNPPAQTAPAPRARQAWEDDADQLMADTAAPAAKKTSVLEGIDLQPGKPWSFSEASQNRRQIDDTPIPQGRSYADSVPEGTDIGMDIAGAVQNPAVRGVVAGVTGLGKVLPGAVRATADFVGADSVADFAGRAARTGDQITAPLQPKGGNEKLVFDIFNSMTQTAPTMLAGIANGPAMRILFSQSAAQEYTDGRSSGLNGVEAASRAGVMAGAEVLGERFGFTEQMQIFKSLAKRIPADELAPIFARQIMKEIPGEQLTTLIQFLGDKSGPGALNPEATLTDYLQQAGDTLKVTIGQTALMGGGPTVINKAREGLAKPIDRTPQIERLRKEGDEVAAAHLERKQNKEQAEYSADKEAGALADFGQGLQDTYKAIRSTGAKAGESVSKASLQWHFEQAAQLAGLSPKAQQAISDKMNDIDPAKAPEFIQKAVTGLVNNGMAQPFDGIDTLALTIEQQRDAMLDSVLSVMDEPQTTEGQPDAPQTPAIETAGETPDGMGATGTEGTQGAEQGLGGAEQVAQDGQSEPSPALNEDWQQFPEQTGTLNVPRAEMPQVKNIHRGPLVNFLGARGVTSEQVEVDPADLKPTQSEFSQSKVDEAADRNTDRSILISSDGHIIDGHHQAIAKLKNGEPVRAIRLNAPAAELIPLVKEFPSSTVESTQDVQDPQAPAAGSQAQAAPAQTPTAGRGDAAAASGVPAKAGAGDVQANGLKIGTTPKNAEAVTVKNGVVHIGKYEAVNYDTGEPVTVKAGATDAQIKQALKDAGALSKNQKVYGGSQDSAPQADPAPVEKTPKAEKTNAKDKLQSEKLESRPDGTLSVTGDSAALKERLTAAGIPAKVTPQIPSSRQMADTRALEQRRIAEKEAGNYARLDGKTIEQKIPVEGMTEPAVLKMDAAKALRDLDAREATLEALKKCLGRKS